MQSLLLVTRCMRAANPDRGSASGGSPCSRRPGFTATSQSVRFWLAYGRLYFDAPAAMTTSPAETADTRSPEEQEQLDVHRQLLLRKELALECLNKRIARLAIALGLKLDTDMGLSDALEPLPQATPHQRGFQQELRGLLTLRYQMEKQLLDEEGEVAMHRMVSEVEQHMERLGFKHGVDGIHEDQLFD